MSTIAEQERLVDLALEKFLPLVDDFGFEPPLVTKSRYMTRIAYLHKEVGIEVELDWKEFDSFVLLVKLDGGRLPLGYYIEDGRPCRRHLNAVLREQGCTKVTESVPPSKRRTEAGIEHVISADGELILRYANDIIRLGHSLF